MQAENSGLIGQLSIRVERLEETMAYLEAKEKDLRTIVIEGFESIDAQFSEVHKVLKGHDELIDTLAIEMHEKTKKIDTKLDILNGNMNKLMGNMGKIMHALAID